MQGYQEVYCRVTRGVIVGLPGWFNVGLPGGFIVGLLLPFMVSIDVIIVFIVECFLRSLSGLMLI